MFVFKDLQNFLLLHPAHLPIMFFELCKHLVELLIRHQCFGVERLQSNSRKGSVAGERVFCFVLFCDILIKVIVSHLKASVVKGELLKSPQSLILARIVRPVCGTPSW